MTLRVDALDWIRYTNIYNNISIELLYNIRVFLPNFSTGTINIVLVVRLCVLFYTRMSAFLFKLMTLTEYPVGKTSCTSPPVWDNNLSYHIIYKEHIVFTWRLHSFLRIRSDNNVIIMLQYLLALLYVTSCCMAVEQADTTNFLQGKLTRADYNIRFNDLRKLILKNIFIAFIHHTPKMIKSVRFKNITIKNHICRSYLTSSRLGFILENSLLYFV